MKTPSRGKWLIATIAIIALLMLAGFWQQQPPKVTVTTLKRLPLTHTVVASGRIQTLERTHIASLLLGEVQQVHVDAQDVVARGQRLLSLDPTELQAALDQAAAALQVATARLARLETVAAPVARENLAQAETQLKQARRQLTYWQRLRAQGNASQDQYDQARETLALRESQLTSARLQLASLTGNGQELVQARSERDQAEAALAVAHARLAHTEVTAPSDGVILDRLVEPGQVVQPGAALFFFAPRRPPQVVVPVDEKNLGYIRPGQRALVNADAFPGQRFEAVVARVAPAVDANRGAVDVELTVNDAPDYLREDMTVSVEIIVAEKAAADVLTAAAVQDIESAAPWVWQVDQQQLHKQVIQIGARDNGNIEVLGGIQTDTPIVIPVAKQILSEGMPVRTEAAAP